MLATPSRHRAAYLGSASTTGAHPGADRPPQAPALSVRGRSLIQEVAAWFLLARGAFPPRTLCVSSEVDIVIPSNHTRTHPGAHREAWAPCEAVTRGFHPGTWPSPTAGVYWPASPCAVGPGCTHLDHGPIGGNRSASGGRQPGLVHSPRHPWRSSLRSPGEPGKGTNLTWLRD